MKPVRTRVTSKSGNELILSSMISKPEKDEFGRYWIYVMERHLSTAPSGQGMLPIDEVKEITAKQIAHATINKWNSTILESYLLEREENGRRYVMSRHIFGDRRNPITKQTCIERTQEDCVRVAMEDYCSRNNLTIVEEL